MSTHDDHKQPADTVVDKAQVLANQASEEAKQKVTETTAVAKEQAKRVVTQVGEQAKSTVEARKSDVAHELGSVADVVRQTSYEAGIGTSPAIVDYGQRIADQIEGISSYLDAHGVEDILWDVQDFGRRQPAVYLGGAFMLGLIAGRFLRSSAGRGFTSSESEYAGYRSEYTAGVYRRDGDDRREDYRSYPTALSPDSPTAQD